MELKKDILAVNQTSPAGERDCAGYEEEPLAIATLGSSRIQVDRVVAGEAAFDQNPSTSFNRRTKFWPISFP